ncbi:MAG: hypothetical protein AAFR61_25270 [Bacteroidota bacterium]
MRHHLGQLLLDQKRFAEAEQVYLADLKQFPKNGWALHGLKESLEGQGKKEEAAAVHSRFLTAWQYADTELKGSIVNTSEVADFARTFSYLRISRLLPPESFQGLFCGKK